MGKHTVSALISEVNRQREHARRLAVTVDRYKRIATDQTKRALAREVEIAKYEALIQSIS